MASQVGGEVTDRSQPVDPAGWGRPRGHVVDQDHQAARRHEPPQVPQGGLQVGEVVQGGGAEDQVESLPIADRQQVASLVADPGMRSGAAGEVDQRLAAVDAHDHVEAVGQGQGMAARSAAGVQGASTVIG
jgi:hypothetical protein